MESQDGRTSARLEDGGQLFEETVEDLKLAVDFDTQRLENTLTGLADDLFAVLLGQEIERLLDGIIKLTGGLDDSAALKDAEDLGSDLFGIGLIRVFHQQADDLIFTQLTQTLGCGDARCGVKTQIEGAVLFEGKAAGGIVDLHGGNAEVSQNEIELPVRCNFVQLGKVHALDGQDFGTEAKGLETGPGLFRLDGIDIGGIHVTLTLELLEHTAGMAAITQCGIQADLTGLDLQKLEDLINHDRNVHTGRCLTLLDDLLDLVLVLFGIVFLIFFFKTAGMGALVAHTALVDRLFAVFVCFGFGCIVHGYSPFASYLTTSISIIP